MSESRAPSNRNTWATSSESADFLGQRGLLPVTVWGVPPSGPEIETLADEWRSTISELEGNAEAQLPRPKPQAIPA